MKTAALPLPRHLGLFSVLLLLLMIFWFSFSSDHAHIYAEENAPDALGSISGVVRNETGEPLVGMQLTLYSAAGYYNNDWQARMQITSDSNGHYHFLALPANIYRLSVADPGAHYGKSFYANQSDVWTATDVTVNGIARTGIDLTLTAAGAITGVLRSFTGASFSEQQASLYQKVTPLYFGSAQSAEWLRVDTQDIPASQNDFNFRGLTSGVYRVCASSYDGRSAWQECYDDVYQVANAQNFTVTAGTVISNVEIVLGDGADLAMISGRVTSAQNEPLANIGVYVIPAYALPPIYPALMANSTPAPRERSATKRTIEQPAVTPTELPPVQLLNIPYQNYTSTTADGTYTVTNVIDGNYHLYFYDRAGNYRYEYYDNVTYRSNATAVVVAQQTSVAGVNAQLEASAHLTGTITLFGQAAPPATLLLYKEENNKWLIMARATSDPSTNHYDIGGLPAGVYRLQATVTLAYSPLSTYSWSSYYGSYDWSTAARIQLATAEIRSNIDINLDQEPRFDGTISGRVTANGNPVVDVKVSLYPRFWLCCEPLFLGNALTYATTDQDGRYRINGLSNDFYYIRYEEPSGAHAAIFYPNTPVLDSTHYITINDTETTTIDVELPPSGNIKGQVRVRPGTARPDLIMVASFVPSGPHGFVYREAPLANDGSFLLPGLYPGSYHICTAVKSVYTPAYYPSDCYGNLRDEGSLFSGQTVLVTAGQTVNGIDILWGPDYKQYLPVVAR